MILSVPQQRAQLRIDAHIVGADRCQIVDQRDGNQKSIYRSACVPVIARLRVATLIGNSHNALSTLPIRCIVGLV